MKDIIRPIIEKEVVEDYLEDLDKLVNNIEGHIYDPDLSNFGWLGLTAYWGAQAAMVAKRSHEDIWRYLCLARDFFDSHYGNVKHQSKRIYIHIEKKEYVIKKSKRFTGKEEHDVFLEPEYWYIHYALCEITNDVEKRNFLIENITEKVMRKYSNKTSTFLKSEFAFIDFLVSINLQITAEEKEKIYENAVDIINKEVIDDEKIVTYKDEIITTPFNLYSTFLYKTSENEFNELIYDAIEGFKYYYENFDEYESPESWYPMLLINAVITRSYHNDYNILFKSDYLPMWLIEKSIKVAKKEHWK